MARTLSCARGACLVFLCAGLFACGDDDGGQVSTGLPQDQMLSTLSAADKVTACETVRAELGDLFTPQETKRLQCTALAVPQSFAIVNNKPSGDVAKCKMLVSRCMSGESIGEDGDDIAIDTNLGDNKDCSEQSANDEFLDCTATVGEYEQCLTAAVAQIDQFFSVLNCDSLSNLEKLQNTVGEGFGIGSLEACEPIALKCPHVELTSSDDEESFESESPAP